MAVAKRDVVFVGVALLLVHWLVQMVWQAPWTALAVIGSLVLFVVLLGVGVMLWLAWVFMTLQNFFSRPSKPPPAPSKNPPQQQTGLLIATVRVLGCIGAVVQGVHAIQNWTSHKPRRPRPRPVQSPPATYTSPSLPPVQCTICLEMVESSGCATCPTCPTASCAPCFEKYLNIKITQDRQSNLTCPGCAAALCADTLQRFLSPYLHTKRRELELAQHAFKCPKCQCMKLTTGRYSTRSLSCTQCKSCWCVDCGKKYHYFATKACYDRSFRQWRAKHPVKACPNCHRFIEKNEGCRHMTCTQCKYEFCWRCLYKWSQHHNCS